MTYLFKIWNEILKKKEGKKYYSVRILKQEFEESIVL